MFRLGDISAAWWVHLTPAGAERAKKAGRFVETISEEAYLVEGLDFRELPDYLAPADVIELVFYGPPLLTRLPAGDYIGRPGDEAISRGLTVKVRGDSSDKRKGVSVSTSWKSLVENHGGVPANILPFLFAVLDERHYKPQPQ